jgi:hypothetical protein
MTPDPSVHPTSAELAQALADMQRALDQLQQQQALLAQALLNAVRGRWDAAQYGLQSVESMLVALDPALHGKVGAVPFSVVARATAPVPLAVAR